MYMFRKNPFTQKHYRYDTDDFDIFTEMFNDEIHDNTEVPVMSCRYTCGYCDVLFESRNQLFHHLGYMGIDIRKCGCNQTCDCASRIKRYRKTMMFKKRKHSKIDSLANSIKFMKI